MEEDPGESSLRKSALQSRADVFMLLALGTNVSPPCTPGRLVRECTRFRRELALVHVSVETRPGVQGEVDEKYSPVALPQATERAMPC